ncbi:peptidoglycan D,D-transpeptidase FtsI family protein [Metabacillus malikii]|uniref:serine-type D-Ala-D-Ala carboxypeptidase n=1 Tax=Metabacillus malikii TaxID=1504265 RepID=A0ABT9ZGY9_9BACI|nr:penicillin-binding protein 2 [Metabacillus malikii]MDQ0231550.1 cell division protein FtsI/penicillin-binding protein 2 [Metabacillus malikii]
MIKKRIIFIGTIIMMGLFVILYRLADIQLIHTESFSKKGVNLVQESVSQRTQEVVIDDGRGRFTDRNGAPLRDQVEPSLVIFPFSKDIEWPVEQLTKIINISESKLNHLLANIKKPAVLSKKEGIHLTSEEIESINNLKIPGIFAIYKQSPIEESIAEHIIGITGENPELLRSKYPDRSDLSYKTQIGITGLEKAFDEFLLPDAETKLLYHVDGDGNPLFGINVKYMADANPFYPVTIETTIDKEIQAMSEDILSKHKIEKGGIVLLDIETNNVLAMVSKPDVNRAEDATLANHMIQPIFPGSIFKTVISAAAIEYGLDDATRQFDCSLNLHGENDGGQDDGMLNFERSFAKSCNYTFTTLAEELIKINDSVIEDTAEKLGLVGPVGWNGKVFHYDNFKQFPNEKLGKIWGANEDKQIKRAVHQTAIGQKDVKVTPMAVANMMATVARGGERKKVRVVENILYKNGTNMYSFTSNSIDGEHISPFTAKSMQKLLRLVVTDPEGTGRRFQSLEVEVSGKSGTAQTGKKTEQGASLYNKWFAGFFPSNQPKYALVVVEMDTTSEESGTNASFYDIVNELANRDL